MQSNNGAWEFLTDILGVNLENKLCPCIAYKNQENDRTEIMDVQVENYHSILIRPSMVSTLLPFSIFYKKTFHFTPLANCLKALGIRTPNSEVGQFTTTRAQ